MYVYMGVGGETEWKNERMVYVFCRVECTSLRLHDYMSSEWICLIEMHISFLPERVGDMNVFKHFKSTFNVSVQI